ncbi:MAG: 6-bladed beta-propeller [Rhodothermales bacterium]
MPFSPRSIPWILFLFVLPAVAQHLRVELVEELAIGDDEDAPVDYLFAGPVHVQVDSQGRLYVADMHRASVSVFDREGVFVTSIGSRGQGPGEIREITTMTVDHHDALIVLDRMNARFTRYANLGKTFEMYPVPEAIMVSSHQMQPLGEDAFALYYRVYGEAETRRTEVMHLYDAGFKAVQASLMPMADLWDLDSPFERAIAGSPSKLYFATDGEDRMLVAPYFYNGVIHRYERRPGGWQRQEWIGKRPSNAPYKLLDYEAV